MKDLMEKTIYILREAKSRFKNPAVMWSTGKDSTAMLALIKKAFYGKIPFPVIHIDTSFKFPEIYDFRDRIANEWELDMIVGRNDIALKEGMHPAYHSKIECCTALKTEVMRKLAKKHKFDALIMSIRRDEHVMRNIERFFSPRDDDMKWHIVRWKTKKEMKKGDSPLVSEQETELWDLYQSEFGKKCSHVRVHPILHWTELDVWKFIKHENLPVNPLYFKGFRSLGCMPCTIPTMPKAKNIDEIIKNLESTNISEREGRSQDKENAMRALRAMGYP